MGSRPRADNLIHVSTLLQGQLAPRIHMQSPSRHATPMSGGPQGETRLYVLTTLLCMALAPVRKPGNSLVFFLAAVAETARTERPVALDRSDRLKAEENTLAAVARWRGTLCKVCTMVDIRGSGRPSGAEGYMRKRGRIVGAFGVVWASQRIFELSMGAAGVSL